MRIDLGLQGPKLRFSQLFLLFLHLRELDLHREVIRESRDKFNVRTIGIGIFLHQHHKRQNLSLIKEDRCRDDHILLIKRIKSVLR